MLVDSMMSHEASRYILPPFVVAVGKEKRHVGRRPRNEKNPSILRKVLVFDQS